MLELSLSALNLRLSRSCCTINNRCVAPLSRDLGGWQLMKLQLAPMTP